MNIKRFFIFFLVLQLVACGPSKSLTPIKTQQPWNIVPSPTVSVPTKTPVVLPSSPNPLVEIPSATPERQPIGQIPLGKGEISQSEYSPDGKRLGLITSQGVYIYSSTDLILLDSIPESAYAAAFSPDWSHLAVGTGSTVQLLRLADKKVEANLITQQGSVTDLLYSPDDSLLVSFVGIPGGESYTSLIDLWRVSDGKLLDTWKAGNILSGKTFSPDGGTLFVWNRFDIGTNSWQVRTDRTVLPAVTDQNLDSLAFSPDGKLLAKALATDSATAGDILIQNVSDVRQVHTLKVGNQPEVGLLQFSPDSSRLFAFFKDGKVRIYRVEDGTLLQTFEAAGQFMAVSPDSRTLALPVADGLDFYNLASGQLVKHLGNFLFKPDYVALSSQGDRLAAMLGHSLAVWQVPGGKMTYLLPVSETFTVAWSPDGKQLALGGGDGKIRLYSAADGSLLRTFMGHSFGVQGVAFSPDETLLASSSMESLKIWRISDGTLVKDIPVTGGWVDNPRFALNGMYLAAWVANYGIEGWQVNDWQPASYLPESIIGDQDVVDYSQYFEYTAIGEEDQIAVWNGMENARELDTGKSQVIIIRISPDGSFLACGLLDGTIELWKLPEGKLLDSFQNTTGRILSLDFLADDKILISFSTDQIIKLWAVH